MAETKQRNARQKRQACTYRPQQQQIIRSFGRTPLIIIILETRPLDDSLRDLRIVCDHVRCEGIEWFVASGSGAVRTCAIDGVDVAAVRVEAEFVELSEAGGGLEGCGGVGGVEAFYGVA